MARSQRLSEQKTGGAFGNWLLGVRMALLPKKHGILDVAPLRPHPRHALGYWSCSVCGVEHAVASSWVLTFRRDSGEDLRFVLCEPCGLERRPVRVVVDLTTLDTLSPNDALVEHVNFVRALRNGMDETSLRIRDEDLLRLAAVKGVEVEELVATWEQRGVARRELLEADDGDDSL